MSRALVLSGGGARGAYQVGVLKALAAAQPAGSQPFSILTGVSVGALNASVLATEPDDFPAGVAKLETIWRALHCDRVFDASGKAVRGSLRRWANALLFGWSGAKAPPSLLDNAPLRTLLHETVDFSDINQRIGHGALKAFAITASSYGSSRTVTFFTGSEELRPWKRARRRGERSPITAEHVMASSALPLVFPAVKVGDVYYGDGALREIAPLSAAIRLGATRIQMIGARDNVPDPEPGGDMDYPNLGYLAGQMLDILFNDNNQADIERARRINETLEMMTPDNREKTSLRPVQIDCIYPSTDLRPIAGEHAGDMPGSLRMVMRSIGALNPPWVLPSYLLFEPGYVGALIDLGEMDGQAALKAEAAAS